MLKKIERYLKRTLGITMQVILSPFVLVMVLALFSNTILNNKYSQTYILNFLNKKLATYGNYEVNFKKINLNLMALRIDFESLNLLSSKTGEPLLSIKKANSGISIANLALGRFQMSNFSIDSLYIDHERIMANLKASETKAESSFSWPPPFPVPVERVKITNFSTKIDAYYQEEDAEIRMDRAEIDMHLYSWNNMKIKISIPSFSYITESVVLAKDTTIDSELNWNGASIAINSLIVKNQSLSLNTEGNIDLLRENQILWPLKVYARSEGSGHFGVLGTFLDFEQTTGNIKLEINSEVEIPKDAAQTKFVIKGGVTLEDAWLFGYSLMDSKAKFDINSDRIHFSDIHLIENDRSYGHASGHVAFDSATDYRFLIKPKNLPLSQLLDILRVDFKAFDFDLSSESLELKGKGSPFAMTLKGPAEFKKMRFPALKAGSKTDIGISEKMPTCLMEVDLKINDDKLQFLNNLGKCQNQSSMSLNGPIYFSNRGIDLDVNIRSPNIDMFSGWANHPLQGSGDIATKVKGPWTAIEVKTELSLQNAFFDKISLHSLKGNATVDINQNMVTWKDIASGTDTSRLLLERGRISIGNYDFYTEIQAENLKSDFLSSILEIVGAKTEFATEIKTWNGSLSGNLLTPGAWIGQGNMRLENAKIGNEVLLNHCSFNYDLNGITQKIDKLGCQIGSTKIAGSGALVRTSSSRGSLSQIGISDSDEIRLELSTVDLIGLPKGPKSSLELSELPYLKEKLASIQLDSDLVGRVNLSGTVGHPLGGGELKLTSLTYRGSPVPALESRFTINNGTFDILASSGGRSSDIRFVFSPFAPKTPYKLKIIASQMDLRWVFPKSFYQSPTNYFLMNAFLDLEGSLEDFFSSRGSLEVKSIKAALSDQEGKAIRFNALVNETVSLKNGSLATLSGRPLKINSNEIHIEIAPSMGSLPSNMDLRADGEFGASLAKVFSSALETASGTVRFESSITGNVESPDFSMLLQNSSEENSTLSFGLKELRPAFSDVEFKASMTSQGLNIERFSARKGSGSVGASGSVSFKNQESSGIDISFREASLIRSIPYLKDFDAILTGKINIKSLTLPTTVTGDIEIVRARLNREFDIRNEIISALRNAKFDVKESKTKESANLDIRLHSDDGISILNRNMNLILACDLKITGSDIDPKILGLIEIKQGKFIYRTDYKISKGLISFDPSQGVDPTLDISANADIDKRRVDIEVTGKGSSPLISISVDPPTKDDGSIITETDAVLLVTTGSLPKGGQGLADSNLTSGGLNIIAGQFEKPVERLFDMTGQKIVKGVYFDTYPSNSPTNTGAPVFRANASLQIVDNLDFIIQADQEQSGFSAEYPIDPNVNSSVNYSKQKTQESFQSKDDEYDAGFDLRFRFQFP